MEMNINNKKYFLTKRAIEESKYLQLYIKQKDKTELSLKSDFYKILDEDISTLVSVLNGNDFRISSRIHVLYFLLQILMCENKIGWLDYFTQIYIGKLRRSSVKIYLAKPDSVWDIDCKENNCLLKYVDRNLISFNDLIRHSMSVSYGEMCFLQKEIELSLFNFEKYMKYEPCDYSLRKYPAVPKYAVGEKILPNRSVFNKRLEQFTFDVLKDLNWDHVALMGGSLSILLNYKLNIEDYPYSDIDLFVVGKKPEDRRKTINNIIEYFTNKNNKVLFYQCGTVLTVILPGINRNIQIIDSGIDSFVKVARGFDCGISQIWYQGNDVLCTPVAALSLLHQINPLMNNQGHHARLYKQYLRGYTTLLVPYVKYSDEFLELFNTKPEILQTNNKIIKALNKYVWINDVDTQEKVDFLVSSTYSPNYKNVKKYETNLSASWLINYVNEEPKLPDLKITPILLSLNTKSIVGIKLEKFEVTSENISLDTVLPHLTDRQLIQFDLTDKNGSKTYLNIGKNKFLYKEKRFSHEDQIVLKLNKISKKILYDFMAKYIEMIEIYLETHYKGDQLLYDLRDFFQGRRSYDLNILSVTTKMIDKISFPIENLNNMDIIVKPNVTLAGRQFNIVYKLVDSFYQHH